MSARVVTFAGYALIVLAAIAWELACARRGGLTLGRLVRWLTGSRVARAVLLLGWAWLGWHLFARGSVAFLSR